MRNPVYLTSWGRVYRLSRRNYRNFLKVRAAGGEPDVRDYGRELGAWTAHVDELTPETARELLASADKEGR